MPIVVQHVVVLLLAVTCAVVLLVRRVRVLRARASACSTCAYAEVCEKRGEIPALGACGEERGAVDGRRHLVVLREAHPRG